MATISMERFIAGVRRYSEFALPIRLAISAALTLAAGTGLGFVAEYAAYNWAMHYGLRPPLEGIPYLRVAVTALTFSILIGGVVAYVGARVMLAMLLDWIHKSLERSASGEAIDPDPPKTMMRKLIHTSVVWYRQRSAMEAVVIAGLASVSAVLFLLYPEPTDRFSIKQLQFFGIGLLCFCAMLLIWNVRVQYWIATAAVALVIFVLPVALFHTEVYGHVLRGLGYGGGSAVSVTVVEDPQSRPARTQVVGYLMLRTSSSLIVYERGSQRMREIPIEQVLFVDHAVTRLTDRPYDLPW